MPGEKGFNACCDVVNRGVALWQGMVYVGTHTGLFRAMQGKGPMRLEDVVQASGMQPRYVEEWLRGMTSAGYLQYSPEKQTYELPEEMAYFVASDGTDHFVGGMWEMVPALMRVAPRVAEAFEKGGGVPFADFGPDCVHALDLINRGQYDERFASYWLKGLPEVVARLQAGGRMLDFGCGSGRVAMAVKRAFPAAQVTGFDIDAQSIQRAREAASGQNLKIEFATAPPKGQFDLVTICDCIHDLAAPVADVADAAPGPPAGEARGHALHRRAEGRRPAGGQSQPGRDDVLRLQPVSLHDAVARVRRAGPRHLHGTRPN